MHKALYYIKKNDVIHCQLCPQACSIMENETGECRVRRNNGGKLYAENYGKVSSFHFDPIEKKPLYHFFPGSVIFSIGTVGCNLKCDFCQNCEISQHGMVDFPYLKEYSAVEIVNMALQNKQNIGIAYTYNEPFIWYEFVLDTLPATRGKGLKNVFVSNGYINPEPLRALLTYADAFNIDLKAFSDDFYRKYTSSTLKPVLKSLKLIRESGCHLEITNLVIPGLNDDSAIFENMIEWIVNELGKDTVLHLSRYHPMNRMTIPPTTEKTLLRLFEKAKKHLDHVYIGNIDSSKGRNTCCPGCGKEVIRRNGYYTQITGLDHSGSCLSCKSKVVVMN